MVFSAVSVQMMTRGSVFDEESESVVDGDGEEREAEDVIVTREGSEAGDEEGCDCCEGAVWVCVDWEVAVAVSEVAATGRGRPLMGLIAWLVCCDCGCGSAALNTESASSAMLVDVIEESMVMEEQCCSSVMRKVSGGLGYV
jgi:hypothetical protein